MPDRHPWLYLSAQQAVLKIPPGTPSTSSSLALPSLVPIASESQGWTLTDRLPTKRTCPATLGSFQRRREANMTTGARAKGKCTTEKRRGTWGSHLETKVVTRGTRDRAGRSILTENRFAGWHSMTSFIRQNPKARWLRVRLLEGHGAAGQAKGNVSAESILEPPGVFMGK